MDGSTFDSLVRTLSAAGSRRRALSGLLTGAFGLFGVWAQETEAHDLTAKCKKKSGEAKKKCLKKAKKHAAERANETLPPPPPPSGCASGQKPCEGTCIPSSQCCDNGDCRISGQVCTDARQCACPAAFPAVCGGACVRACTGEFTYDPSCACCVRNTFSNRGSSANCCSRRSSNGFCEGFPVGSSCTFGDQCAFINCVQGTCSSCAPNWDSCVSASITCGAGGRCLKAVDGTTRCGIFSADQVECGRCTANDACDQGMLPGGFCAVATGANCPCANGQTFCASPA